MRYGSAGGLRVDIYGLQRRDRYSCEQVASVMGQPHCETVYPVGDGCVIYDVADLLIYHVKRQPSAF
jgi:hypothetical protein